MVYVQRQHSKKHDTRRITKSHRKSSVTAKKKKRLSEPKKKKKKKNGLFDKEKELEPK